MIAIATVDTIGTLVATRIRTRRWWPTAVLYRYSWAPWRGMAKRIDDEDDRESFLSIYGPLSLLMLLVFWAGMQVVGWGLVWWGMRNGIPTLDSLLRVRLLLRRRVLHDRIRRRGARRERAEDPGR